VRVNLWIRASRWSFFAAALLLAAAGLRLGYVAWQELPAPEAPAISTVPRSIPLADLEKNLSVLDAQGALLKANNEGNVATPPVGEVLALIFVLTDGPRRDVLLDGSLVGESPYMGQTHCERGSQVTITLRSKEGVEKQFKRSCSSEIRISD
jgi:hypothetical protein